MAASPPHLSQREKSAPWAAAGGAHDRGTDLGGSEAALVALLLGLLRRGGFQRLHFGRRRRRRRRRARPLHHDHAEADGEEAEHSRPNLKRPPTGLERP